MAVPPHRRQGVEPRGPATCWPRMRRRPSGDGRRNAGSS